VASASWVKKEMMDMILLTSFGSPWMNSFLAGLSRRLETMGHTVVIGYWDEFAGRQLRRDGCRNILNMVDLYLRSDLPAVDDEEIRSMLWFNWKAGTSTPDGMPADYEQNKICRAQLASSSVRFALKLLEPTTILIWNNLSFGGRILDKYGTDACRFYLERGPLPGTVQFSRRGVNADLQTAFEGAQHANENSVATADTWIETYKQRKMSAWPEHERTTKPRETISMVRGRPIVLFVAQVPYDTQIVWHSQYGYNYPHVYDDLKAAWVGDQSDYQLVIKLHPVSYPDLHVKARDIPGAIVVQDGDIRDYLEDPAVERVITVNSSVGFEALLYGKEVYTIGSNWYTGLTKGIWKIKNFLMHRVVVPDSDDGRRRRARDLLASAIAKCEMYSISEIDVALMADTLGRADAGRRGIAASSICAALNGG
jgi:hypothetical protein